jgi:YcaO-like protein with predicted kinase domain
LIALGPWMRAAGITRVANITGLDDVGIPVAIAVRPNARSLSVSQGKGSSLLAAKLSAIGEALEHFHAEEPRLPIWLMRYRSLKNVQSVVDIEKLPKTSRPFDPHARIPWVEAISLSTHESVAVPYELVHLDFSLPLPEGSGYFPLGSNGLGAGRTLADAILHGLLELVERDALALFYERGPSAHAERRVRLNTVDDPSCSALIHKLENAGLGIAIWDMTSDVGIPAWLCSVGERSFDPLRPVGTARGYGCHPDRAIALCRALTEAAQSRLTRIAGSRDDIQPSELAAIRSPGSVERQQEHVRQESFARRSFTDLPAFDEASTQDLTRFVCDKLERAELADVLYVDLSRAECPMSVVRVLVPGLEGFPDDPGYVAGVRAKSARSEAVV